MITLLLPLWLLAYGPPNPHAAPDEPAGPQHEFAATVAFVNEYVHRGEPLAPAGLLGTVGYAAMFDERLRVEVSNSTFLQLGAFDFGESITDLSVSCDFSPGSPWRYTAGWRMYDRNNWPVHDAFLGDDTQEVYVGVDYQAGFAAWAFYHYDYDRGDGLLRDQVGSYLNVGAARSWPFAEGEAQFDLSGKLGFDAGRGIDLFRDALVYTGVTWRPLSYLAVRGGIDWWLPSGQVPGASGIRPTIGCGVTYQRSY